MTEQSTSPIDQPVVKNEESAVETDQVNGQSETTESENSETDNSGKTETVYEIDGEKLTPEQIKEFKAGYLRQQDYTKKTQELAEERKKLSRNETESKADEIDPDVKAALDILKKAGVVTKEDLALSKAQEEDQKRFNALLTKFPELKAHERAIAQIGKVDNRDWEEIAKDYGFLKDDKLAKAKESKPIVGAKGVSTPKAKSVADMSPSEYREWKKQNLGDGLVTTN